MKRTRLLRLAALLGLIVVLFLVLQRNQQREALRQVVEPTSFDFQCTACQHAWNMKPHACAAWYPGGMHNANHAVACLSCEKKAAFILTTCPWCSKGYIPDYLRKNPKDYPEEDFCPHCGKDTLTWER